MISPNSPFVRLLASSTTIAIVAAMVEFRNLSWTKDLGFVPPSVGSATAWLLGWTVWIVVISVAGPRLGVPRARRWRAVGVGRLAALFVGIVLLAPLAEELLFRGLLYWRVAQTAVGVPGAIIAGAVAFAVLHLQYGWRESLVTLLDGILLGLARHLSGSVILTIFMHGLANVYAYAERLPKASPRERR